MAPLTCSCFFRCSMFNADLALSVTMTAISTLLSTIFLPVNLLIYARYSYEADVIMALDWTSLFVALAIVIGAIGLGLFCSAKIHSHKFNLMANHVRNTDVQCIVGLSFSHFLNYNQLGNWAGIALIIFSATMTNTGGEDTKIWERDWKFYVGTTLPCLRQYDSKSQNECAYIEILPFLKTVQPYLLTHSIYIFLQYCFCGMLLSKCRHCHFRRSNHV